MDSRINKDWAQNIMEGVIPDDAIKSYAEEKRIQGGILVALIELRETIADGFARLDQTKIEGSMLLIGIKESLDQFLEDRLGTDKVLESLIDKIKVDSKPEVDKPKKSAVTLDVGDFGGPMQEAGIV